ncbi:MAG: endoglucanase [Blastocatellia bacterium]|jgi:aryl-phospho-beta-D-glucosidase BglC (GH1 family)|nr:endoglucanase [Blastocatellia bacterium]
MRWSEKKQTCWLSVLLLTLFAWTSINAQPRFVTTRGKLIVSGDGKPLLLKGINLGNWLLPEGYMFKFKQTNSPRLIQTAISELVGEDEARKFWKTYRENYITQADIHFIKQSGFNSVRVPFSYRLFVSDTTVPRLEGPGYELLDRVVDWCRREGIYVILDMHAAPGGQTGDNIDDSFGYPFLFESSESQELTVNLWRKLAARYRNQPTVIGYDLLNEPIAHYFDTASLNPKLEPLYRRIVSGIREVDGNHIIFLGGAQWDGNFKVFGPPFDPKLAYTFHKYWMTVNQDAIQQYLTFRDKYNVPVWMGESGENTDEWIDSFRTLLEAQDIGWCFWPYKKLDATSCIASINSPGDWTAIIAFADGPRTTFEEVRKHRPPKEKVEKALNDYLERIKFANCRINQGYLKALGLR